jgi:AAA+ ATPase superfamily predicted ATPase
MKDIVGRKNEIALINDALASKKSELIAVYGRRRVGKTFLIREACKNNVVFEVTGLYQGNQITQLENFTKEINRRKKGKKVPTPKKWIDAFNLLEDLLNTKKGKSKKVVFIDEFPWIATQKSNFLTCFENFWNSYVTKRKDLVVIICGSAASYMVQKIIKNKGGLHNRISQKIRLLPFNLNETSDFLKSRGIKYTPYDILQLYMVMGGIPHYLDKLKKGDSVAQNIDRLCFHKDGALNDEFNHLFASLFDDSPRHITIIKALARVRKGLTRDALLKTSKIKGGGDFSKKIEELIESGFVNEYTYHQNKTKQTLYRLSDEYSLFYLNFIMPSKKTGKGTWHKLYKSSQYTSWCGFSFETLCLKHIEQIKKALGIQGIYSTNSSWFNKHAQIDLLIDRDDNIITICELKFSQEPFTINKKYYQNLKNKISELKRETKTRKNVFLTMITTFGTIENLYKTELVENEITANDLFS